MKPAKTKRLSPFALTRGGAQYPIRQGKDGQNRIYSAESSVPVVGINHAMRQAESWARAGIKPPKGETDV